MILTKVSPKMRSIDDPFVRAVRTTTNDPD